MNAETRARIERTLSRPAQTADGEVDYNFWDIFKHACQPFEEAEVARWHDLAGERIDEATLAIWTYDNGISEAWEMGRVSHVAMKYWYLLEEHGALPREERWIGEKNTAANSDRL